MVDNTDPDGKNEPTPPPEPGQSEPPGPSEIEEPAAGKSAASGKNLIAVNQQIVDAVEKSTDFVFGMPQSATGGAASGTTSDLVPKYNAGAVIAYDKVAQAAAYSIQDATDFQRNMLSIFGAAQGKAIALMVVYANKKPPEAANIKEMKEVLKEAQTGATAASTLFAAIGKAAAEVVKEFPK